MGQDLDKLVNDVNNLLASNDLQEFNVESIQLKSKVENNEIRGVGNKNCRIIWDPINKVHIFKCD